MFSVWVWKTDISSQGPVIISHFFNVSWIIWLIPGTSVLWLTALRDSNQLLLDSLGTTSRSADCQAMWCNPFKIRQTVLCLASATFLHHLAGELLYIKSPSRALCLNPSALKGYIKSLYWISNDQSWTVQMQWLLPDDNEQMAKRPYSMSRLSHHSGVHQQENFPKPMMAYSLIRVWPSGVIVLCKKLLI